jgi:predicted secreted hydrolase
MKLPALILLISLLQLGPPATAAAADSDYLAVTGPCRLHFPEDHGPHPGYRTEWWYYTGNLESPEGRPYGFQLTFFRSQISPPGSESSWPKPASAWRTQQIFLAHAAISDISRKQFHHTERIARGTLGLSGAEASSDSTRIFLGEWQVSIGEGRHRLLAKSDRFELDLQATPEKPPVLQGRDGYSRKGPRPEQASCYYSFTRLQIGGQLRIGGESIPVSGPAWMDHEFSSAPLDARLVGWDWFSLQFNNHSELMIYLLRDRSGGTSLQSAGTYVTPRGDSMHLSSDAIRAEVIERWRSPRSGADYPSTWRIGIPSLGIDVRVVPRMEDQELHTPGSTRITYWEGSVSARGTAMGSPVTGLGYMELTGYAQPLDSRF